MKVFCPNAIMSYEEFESLIAAAKRRYPNYEFCGIDEFSMELWQQVLERYNNSVAFYIVENHGGHHFMGFYPSDAPIVELSFFEGAEKISRGDLYDILNFKNTYTYRSKRLKSSFTLQLNIDLQERKYA